MRMRIAGLLLLCCSAAFSQTPTFVQSAVLDGSSNGASVSSVSKALNPGGTGGTTPGNAIIVRLGYVSTTADYSSCSDDNGNIYSLAVQKANSTNAAAVAIAYALNIVGGAVTVTCKTGSGHTFFSMSLEEWSNIYAVSAVDASNSASCSSATSTSYNLTTTAGSDGLFSVTNWSGASGTKTVGTGWTSNNSTALAAIGAEDRVAGASGSYTAAISWTSTTNCASAAAAFFAGTAPARAFVWKSNVYVDNSSNGTSLSSVQTGDNLLAVGAGNAVFVWMSFVGTSTADIGSTPCTDNLGNSYTLAVAAANTNGSGSVSAIAYATNVIGGFAVGGFGQHIICTLAHGHSFFSIYAAEFSGVARTSALDVTGSTTANSTSIAKTVTTNFGTELAIVATNWNSAHGALTLGANMFSHNTVLFANLGEEDFITGAAGVYTGAITYATSGQSVMTVATFKLASPSSAYILRRIAGPF